MACDWTCNAQGVLDVFLGVSAVLYCFVLFLVVKDKNIFSYTFRLSLLSVGAADLLFGLSSRLVFVFPLRNWFRCSPFAPLQVPHFGGMDARARRRVL